MGPLRWHDRTSKIVLDTFFLTPFSPFSKRPRRELDEAKAAKGDGTAKGDGERRRDGAN